MTEAKVRPLQELVEAMGDLVLEPRPVSGTVTGLANDSRAVRAGDLFFAVPGTAADGHQYIPRALEAGAAALCVQRAADASVPVVLVEDVRKALARSAAEWYGNPASSLRLLGVTGTNGKTTTVYLLESILRAAGSTTGLIGTVESRIADNSRPGIRTTPDSLELQSLLAEMRDAGVDAVAMEVTSHALSLHRIEGLAFEACAFTNLSQDHLDFHSSMEDYFEAKRSLFTPDRVRRAAVNVDDDWGRRLLENLSVPRVTFALANEADVKGDLLKTGPWGSEFVVRIPDGGEMKISTPLVGTFNVSNCLAACATALQAGIAPDAIERGLSELNAVPGRFESVDAGQPFTVVVDYAHTPDSLDNVLQGARDLAAGNRVVCVFGCGGDRDKGKRPLMGAVAARLADYTIVTSDNPRSEDPIKIIDAIVEGVLAERSEGPDEVLPDRSEAISSAIAEARPGDVVVIAGKGHETGQEFADHTIPFDDRDVVRRALQAAGFGGRA